MNVSVHRAEEGDAGGGGDGGDDDGNGCVRYV